MSNVKKYIAPMKYTIIAPFFNCSDVKILSGISSPDWRSSHGSSIPPKKYCTRLYGNQWNFSVSCFIISAYVEFGEYKNLKSLLTFIYSPVSVTKNFWFVLLYSVGKNLKKNLNNYLLKKNNKIFLLNLHMNY